MPIRRASSTETSSQATSSSLPPLPRGGRGGGRGKDASESATNVGDPKILDFGLAKQLISREASLISLTGQVVGTLPYMSPEQAEGNPDKIDIRTDVYALGVILYQMLTGHYPYPVAGQMAEVLKHIAETEPTPPTRSWKSGSGVTQRTHKRIRPGQCPIDDEVQTIVMRTLAKERERRYQSAGELAKDVGHYLADEPIDAKRDSAFYVIRKQLRRYKLPVAVAAAFVLLLTGATVALSIMYQNQNRAREKAVQASHVAEQARQDETKQRQIAEIKTTEAIAAKKQADERAESLRRFLYANTFASAQDAYRRNDFEQAKSLLDECATDLRGWEWYRLSSLYDQSTLTLHGHIAAIRCLAFSPDGKRLASGSEDHLIKVWNTATGKNLVTLEGHDRWVRSVAFSPDGKRIVSGSSDYTVMVWDAVAGTEIVKLHGHEKPITAVAFSADGKKIVSGDDLGNLKVWDAESGEGLQTRRGHQGRIYSVAFSPDGKHITSGGGNTVKIWDAATGECTLTQNGYGGAVQSSALRSDGKLIVLESGDKTWTVWNAVMDKSAVILREKVSANSSLAMSPDGQRIVSGGSDKTLKVWDTAPGKSTLTLRGHESRVTSVAFNADGSQIISGDEKGTIKAWEATKIEGVLALQRHDGRVRSVAFSPNGRRIVSGSDDNTLKLWDAATGENLLTLDGHEGPVNSVIFSPDGLRIVSGGADKTLKLWDAVTGMNLLTLNGHDGEISSVAFSPDGKWIVSGSDDTTVKTWDANTGKNTLTMHGDKHPVTSVAFSSDGKRIVSVNSCPIDGTVRTWDALTGDNLLTLGDGVGSSVVFSPDSRWIVCWGEYTSLLIWDAVSGESLRNLLTLQSHADETTSIAFSQNGRRILSVSWRDTINIWDTTAETRLMTLPGNKSSVNSIAFSPDGRRIVSGSMDGTIKVWETSIPSHAILMKRRAMAERYRRAEALKKKSAEVREDGPEEPATTQPATSQPTSRPG